VGKAPGTWRWPPTPIGPNVKERVGLSFYPPRALIACSKANFTFFTLFRFIYKNSPRLIPGQYMWNLRRTKWQEDRLLSEYSGLPLSLSSHQCSIPTFIYTLLLQEGQMGEAWEPSKKQSSFGNRGALEEEHHHLKEQNWAGNWQDWYGSGQVQMAGTCQHGTETSGSIRYGKFLQQLRNDVLTKKGSDVCSNSQKMTKFSNRTKHLGRTSSISI